MSSEKPFTCLYLLSDSSSPIGRCRSFETQLSRVEAELLRREAPPSYGQLIAQGLIPPVEDFPVCSGSQVVTPVFVSALFNSLNT